MGERPSDLPLDQQPRLSANKRRASRAVSLTVDWDNVLSSQSRGSDDLKLRVDNQHRGFSLGERPEYEWCTKSTYTGTWNALGMAGFGDYTMPHGVIYDGNLMDGMFHGEGTLHFPNNSKLDGVWKNGELVKMHYRFADGLEYNESWEYCIRPDRRYYTCIEDGLKPAGRSLKTNQDPPRPIPLGCYDTGDGFYDPRIKCVVSAINHDRVLRVPSAAEEEWIVNNCRKAWDEWAGYRPDLYERFASGKAETAECSKCSTETEEGETNLSDQTEQQDESTRTSDDREKCSGPCVCEKNLRV